MKNRETWKRGFLTAISGGFAKRRILYNKTIYQHFFDKHLVLFLDIAKMKLGLRKACSNLFYNNKIKRVAFKAIDL